jgi:hypothetical protein
MPKKLDQLTSATEHVQVTGIRVAFQCRLHLDCQAVHAAPDSSSINPLPRAPTGQLDGDDGQGQAVGDLGATTPSWRSAVLYLSHGIM